MRLRAACLYIVRDQFLPYLLRLRAARMYIVKDQFFFYLLRLCVSHLNIIILTQQAIIGSRYTRPGSEPRCTWPLQHVGPFSFAWWVCSTSSSLSLRPGCGRPFHIYMGLDIADLLPIHQPPSLVANEVKQEDEVCKIEWEGKKECGWLRCSYHSYLVRCVKMHWKKVLTRVAIRG